MSKRIETNQKARFINIIIIIIIIIIVVVILSIGMRYAELQAA